MLNMIIRQFINLQQNMDDENYLLSTIAYSIAPTIGTKKPSSLVTFTRGNRNLYELWDKYKDEISGKLTVQFLELRRTEYSTMVLFYNPRILKLIINGRKHRSFLEECGYKTDMDLHNSLELLRNRFAAGCPHEIGIFLGIPIEDVLGFIENKGKSCLLCKYWKVYHNPERAKTIFDNYDKAKINIMRIIKSNREFYKSLNFSMCS
ncbi:MAG: DUF3793 family protein [Clostridia bacterium]|nr:DUF3793 family protein [Clostridia bacterium]